MRIFISYASAHHDTAESIALRLRRDGHVVFFDRHSLRAAEEFDTSIRREVESADLFVFLITPEAVRAGAYTLTELDLMQQRWPDPSGRVLPVMLESTPINDLPPYARAVTVFHAKGNLVAEVAAQVAKISGQRRRRRMPYVLGGAVLVGLVAIGYALMTREPASENRTQQATVASCFLHGRLRYAEGPPDGLTLRVSGGGISQEFVAAADGGANIHVTAEQLPHWELRVIDPDGRTLGSLTQDGCPTADVGHVLSERLQLELGPRDVLP